MVTRPKTNTKNIKRATKGKVKTTRAKSAAKKAPALKTAGKRLVIVESPAKARTVGQILGNKYVVTASQGHVRDLPKGKMGVDLEQDFEPSYVTMKEKRTLLNGLKKAGDAATEIFLHRYVGRLKVLLQVQHMVTRPKTNTKNIKRATKSKVKTTRAKSAAKQAPALKTAGKRLVIVESPAKARTVGQGRGKGLPLGCRVGLLM